MKSLFRLSRLCIIVLVMTLLACSPFTAVDKPIENWTHERDHQLISQAMIGRSPAVS